jgi:epoxyqueuosine reductase
VCYKSDDKAYRSHLAVHGKILYIPSMPKISPANPAANPKIFRGGLGAFPTLLLESAKKAGFPLAGVVDIELALSDPDQLFQKHVAYYQDWVGKGYAGEMNYLVRGQDRRADPRLVFPKAESVFCVAVPYSTQSPGASSPSQGPKYARYLRGPDYHHEIKRRLDTLMNELQPQWPGLEWKVCVDTSAVLERTWAYLTGLGWIGKNTLLIHPQYGSYLFLAEVLINQKTGIGPSPIPNYCGSCTRCLEGCPTKALQSAYELNSNQCISYWTLEKRGDLKLTPIEKAQVGSWVAGCDRCQEVCPFNLKRTKAELQEGLEGPDPTLIHSWNSLLNETEEEYRSRVKASALSRVKPDQFKRNLKITYENLGDCHRVEGQTN